MSRYSSSMKWFHLALLATTTLAVMGCNAPGLDLDIPLPDLEGVDPPLAIAVREASEKVRKDPSNQDTWIALADLLYTQKWYEEAEAIYALAGERGLLEIGPKYRLARSAAMSGRTASAVLHVEEVLTEQPNYAPGWVFLGELKLDLGEMDASASAFTEALKHDPEEAFAARGLGQIALRRGEINAALSWLEKAVNWRPSYAEAHHSLAQAYLAVGNDYRANEHAKMTQSLEKRNSFEDPLSQTNIPPISSQNWNDHGTKFVKVGKYQEAEAAFQRSLEIKPNNPQALYNLGSLLARMGRLEEGKYFLTQAHAFRPNHLELLVNLGVTELDLNDAVQANRYLEQALKLNPEHKLARRSYAKSFAALGNLERAIQLLKDDSLEGDPESMRVLAWIYLAQRRTEDAIELLKHEPRRTDPRWIDLKAAILMNLERKEEAALMGRRAYSVAMSMSKQSPITAEIGAHSEAYKDGIILFPNWIQKETLAAN